MSTLPEFVPRGDDIQFAVELAPDAMLRISSCGRIVYANQAAHEMLGYDPEELVALEIFDIAPSYSRDKWAARCQHLREVGARAFETTYLTKTSDPVPVDVAVSHQTYGGEDFAEIVARDISAKKALEEQVLEIQDRERTRIGQDLHDDIGQRLIAISLSLNVLASELARQESPSVEEIRELAHYARETLEHTRALAHGLSPIPEYSTGLTGALDHLAASSSRTLGVDCAVECCCEKPVEDSFVINNAYRIAQEAIANAVKHGKAKQINILCGKHDGRLNLSIIDDGCGIDGPPGSGLGTRIMTYRARAIGGLLTITPGAEAGTVVRLTLPIPSVEPSVAD